MNLREICNLDQNLLLLPESLLSGCGGSDDDSRPRSNVVNLLLITESKKGLCAASERYAVDLAPCKTICFSEGIPCFDQ